jgi:hypothetical protein
MTTTEEKNNIDINAGRNGYKWTISECLRLEREYDLLKLSVPEMAILHKRTINAIMCKLQDEGYDTFNNLYIKTFGQEGTIFGQQEGTIFGQQEGTQQEETLEDHLDELVNKLNNLSCSVESEDDEEEDNDDDDDDDEDYEDESDDESEDDDESDDDDDEGEYKVAHNIAYDDGSNKAYIFDQVKQIHKHITNLLGYFTKTTSSKEMLSK